MVAKSKGSLQVGDCLLIQVALADLLFVYLDRVVAARYRGERRGLADRGIRPVLGYGQGTGAGVQVETGERVVELVGRVDVTSEAGVDDDGDGQSAGYVGGGAC